MAGPSVRPLLYGILTFGLALAPAAAQTPEVFRTRPIPGDFLPDKADVLRIEAAWKTTTPISYQVGQKAGPLESYARHYAGIMKAGHRVILGDFLGRESPGMYIESFTLLREIHGGCDHISVQYDLDDRKFLHNACNVTR